MVCFFHYLLAGPEEPDPVQFFQSLSPGLDKPWMVSASQNLQPDFLCVFSGSPFYCKDRLKGRPCREVSKPALAVEHSGETFQDVWVTCSNLAEITIQNGIYLQSRCQSAPPSFPKTNGEFSYFRFFWVASCTKKQSQKHINQQTTYCLMVPRSCTTWLKPLWIMG